MKLDENTIRHLRSELLAWSGLRSVQVSDREDLVQDTLCELLESPRDSSDVNLVPYAKGILRYRRALLFRRRLQGPHFVPLHEDSASPGPAPIEAMAFTDRVGLIADAIAELSERNQEVLYMRVAGLKDWEIAEKLGSKTDTIRKRLYRTFEKLRKAYFDRD